MPTYDVSAPDYLRALGAGLATSGVCGAIVRLIPLLFLAFFAALAAGGAIAEVISRVTNHKRGMGLQIVAALSIILGYLLADAAITLFRFGAPAWPLVLASLLNPYYWIYPVVATGVAVMRLR